jgi:hypothetical protein
MTRLAAVKVEVTMAGNRQSDQSSLVPALI